MRIIVRFEKGYEVRFISHLDVQRAFHRAINRARIPIAYSQGFNPHPKTSFASALPVGQTGGAEWMELALEKRADAEDVKTRLNLALPGGLHVIEAVEAREGYPSLSSCMKSARYSAETLSCYKPDRKALAAGIKSLLSGPVIVEKRKKSKGGFVTAETDIRPLVLSMEAAESDGRPLVYISGRLDAGGGLNAASLLNALNARMETDVMWRIHREDILLDPAPV